MRLAVFLPGLLLAGPLSLRSVPAARAALPEAPPLGDVGAALPQARAGALSMPAVEASGLEAQPAPDNPWSRVHDPTKGPPASIGRYDAGCLRGALPLEDTGTGFQVMRLSRRRFFGHPRLLEYLRRIGKDADGAGLGALLIGDLGQPRGGPTLSGHASHMNGLDVDIWLAQVRDGKVLSPEERETLDAPQLVVPDFEGLSKDWDPREIEVLKVTASDGAVARVFINPVIKKAACDAHKGESWLSKVRPWWGHDDHLHVRLSCAPHDAHCQAQEPPPSGDGCDASLAGWFTPESKAKAKYMREHPTPSTMPHLPAECRDVLKER